MVLVLIINVTWLWLVLIDETLYAYVLPQKKHVNDEKQAEEIDTKSLWLFIGIIPQYYLFHIMHVNATKKGEETRKWKICLIEKV